MNRSKYAKILLCTCILTFVLSILSKDGGLGIQARAAQSNSAQVNMTDIGRDNPFAAIPRSERIVPQKITEPTTTEQVIEAPELFLETISLRFINVKNLEGVVRSMSSHYGSLATDPNTNSLIVCDTNDYLDRILAEIKKIDKRPQQIMVEVVILDVQLKDDTEIGINWDLLAAERYDIGYRQNFTLSADRLKSIAETDDTVGDTTAFNTTGLAGDFSVIIGTVRNVLHLIQEKRNAQIIASPRVMMVSGQSANIRAVEEIPYTELSSTSGGGSMTSTAFKNVGISLQVTAVLTDGNDIFLTVSTEQNVKTSTSATGVPVVDTRRANTSLLLSDGQIVVIGGLRRQEKTLEVDQIPILGDLPLIGRLFKSTSTVINNSELVVLLSPHIYKGEPVPQGALEKYNEIRNRPELTLPEKEQDEGLLW